MATERLSMRKAREILRQKWELSRTHREIAASVGQSLGAVALTLGRAKAAGLDWAQAQALSDAALEERIYGPKAEATPRSMPPFEYLHAERKKPGVTLELLHLEYLERQPDGYRYTQFCEHYRAWLSKRGLTIRSTGPARSSSSTTRARSRTSSTRRPARSSRSSCSSRCWGPRTTPSPRRP
jgi:hypothetical protein